MDNSVINMTSLRLPHAILTALRVLTASHEQNRYKNWPRYYILASAKAVQKLANVRYIRFSIWLHLFAGLYLTSVS